MLFSGYAPIGLNAPAVWGGYGPGWGGYGPRWRGHCGWRGCGPRWGHGPWR